MSETSGVKVEAQEAAEPVEAGTAGAEATEAKAPEPTEAETAASVTAGAKPAGAETTESPGVAVAEAGSPKAGPAEATAPRITVQLAILLALAIAAGGLVVRLLWPFLPAMVMSSVLAVLVYPAYRRLEQRMRHRSVAAFVGTVVVFFLLVAPALGIGVVVVDQIRGGLGRAADQAAAFVAPHGTLAGWIEAFAAHFGLDPARLMEAVDQQVQGLAGTLADRTLGFISGVGGWALQAGAALFTFYYLLRDADGIVRRIRWFIPLDQERSGRLLERAREVTYATVYGNLAVALAQGALGGLGFLVVGVPSAALWGAVMALFSLLPVVGTTVVWLPAGILLISGGHLVRGLILLAYGALLISTVDNLLRALLVSDRAQLHPLVVFFSVLGGLFLFGAVGIIVGPVVFVLATTLIEMAHTALAPAASPDDAGGSLAGSEPAAG